MLYAKWIHGSDDISLAKAVREQVFVNEQGFAPEAAETYCRTFKKELNA